MKARWVLPVVLVVMILTVGAGVVARALYTQPRTGAEPAVVVSESAVPESQQPGDRTVMATTDAAAHPLYPTVRRLLQTYFDAINAKDYELWRTVVVNARAKRQPEKAWRADYETSRDGSIVVRRIESGPADTARVLLSFTSVQDPAKAPPELPERCIQWQVVFPLSVEDDTWRLDSGPTTWAPQHQKC